MSTKQVKQAPKKTAPVASGKSFVVKAFEFLMVNVLVTVSLVLVKFALQHFELRVYEVAPQFRDQKWDTEGKVHVITTLAFYYALYFFALSVLVMVNRLFGHVDATAGTDNKFMVIINRVIQNSLEQGAIFFPIYVYFTLYFSGANDKNFTILIGFMFLVCRVAYMLGYLLLLVSNIPFRSVGMSMGIFSYVILLGRIFGFDIQQEVLSKIPFNL